MLEITILGKTTSISYFALFLGGIIALVIFKEIICYIISILPEWVKNILKGIVSVIVLGILGRIFYYYKVQEGLGVLLSIGLTFFTVFCFFGVLGVIGSVLNSEPPKMKSKLACAFCKNKICELTGICHYKSKNTSYLDPWGDNENY